MVLKDRLKIDECFFYMKQLIKGAKGRPNFSKGLSENKSMMNEEEPSRMTEEVKKLKLLIQQKDN